MNELIPTQNNENGEIVVSGRVLHGYLEVKEKYTQWFERMTEYGFAENVDFIGLSEKTEKPLGGRPKQNHLIKIPMAKEISMLQRNEKGKEARKYFIQLESMWNSPEMVMKRALQFAYQKVMELQTSNLILNQQVNELQPKADYTDRILKNKGLVTITQIAKDYGMSAQKMNDLLHELKVQFKQSGQWLLYKGVDDKGYTHSDTVDITRKDGTPDVRMNTKWTQKGRLFIYDLLKQENILPLIEKKYQTL